MPSLRRSGRTSGTLLRRLRVLGLLHGTVPAGSVRVEVEEIQIHNEDGETWRQLSVIFSPGIPTHSTRQTFYFNDKGLLQRLDYATGVAANYCFDHVTFDGIVVPTFRRVVKRKPEGPVIHGPTAVLIVISDVSLS